MYVFSFNNYSRVIIIKNDQILLLCFASSFVCNFVYCFTIKKEICFSNSTLSVSFPGSEEHHTQMTDLHLRILLGITSLTCALVLMAVAYFLLKSMLVVVVFHIFSFSFFYPFLFSFCLFLHVFSEVETENVEAIPNLFRSYR